MLKQRRFNGDSTSSLTLNQRYIDVVSTLCACWVGRYTSLFLWRHVFFPVYQASSEKETTLNDNETICMKCQRHKWRCPGNATITKHNIPEAPREGEVKNNNDKINTTYEPTDTQTQKNCNRVGGGEGGGGAVLFAPIFWRKKKSSNLSYTELAQTIVKVNRNKMLFRHSAIANSWQKKWKMIFFLTSFIHHSQNIDFYHNIHVINIDILQIIKCVDFFGIKTFAFWWHINEQCSCTAMLTLKAPRKTAYENVVCLCRLLNILANF